MYLSFPNKSIFMLILLLMNLYKFQSPFSAIGSRLIIFRLLGCNSGNCNKPRQNHRRASRRTTGRAGRGLPWKLPVRSSKGKRPARGSGGVWLSVPEDPTTTCGARSGCWTCPGRLLAISLSHVGLATFLHRVTMKNEVSVYRNLCIQVMDI